MSPVTTNGPRLFSASDRAVPFWYRPGMPALSKCALLGALAAALLGAGCNRGSPAPCTSCRFVQGRYTEIAQPNTAQCGGGRVLTFSGGAGNPEVSQSGSRLSIAASQPVVGVLHEDGSASFGPIDTFATSSDGPNSPGKMYLEGWFGPATGTVTGFDGTYVFIANDDGCEVDGPVRWGR